MSSAAKHSKRSHRSYNKAGKTQKILSAQARSRYDLEAMRRRGIRNRMCGDFFRNMPGRGEPSYDE